MHSIPGIEYLHTFVGNCTKQFSRHCARSADMRHVVSKKRRRCRNNLRPLTLGRLADRMAMCAFIFFSDGNDEVEGLCGRNKTKRREL
jgi:hypothetical protein